jgi:glyoxylase I family protein
MPDIAMIHHVGVTVTDVERSTLWYTEVFGFTKLMEETHPDGTGYVVVLGKPDWSTCIGLHTHPANQSEPFSETRTGLDHISFLVPSRAELDAWETRLTELAVEHSPVSNQSGYSVLAFRAPDDIQLELILMG